MKHVRTAGVLYALAVALPAGILLVPRSVILHGMDRRSSEEFLHFCGQVAALLLMSAFVAWAASRQLKDERTQMLGWQLGVLAALLLGLIFQQLSSSAALTYLAAMGAPTPSMFLGAMEGKERTTAHS